MDDFQVRKKSWLVGAGWLGNIVLNTNQYHDQQHSDVFLKTTELFILLPILLNLKGNLEMNLAARFSTSVIGNPTPTCKKIQYWLCKKQLIIIICCSQTWVNWIMAQRADH